MIFELGNYNFSKKMEYFSRFYPARFLTVHETFTITFKIPRFIFVP